MAKISDERLHDCMLEMMELEDRLLEEEMKQAQPHVFSEKFEKKMEEVMRVQARVCKRSDLIRYLASAAVVILMVFGLLVIGNEDLRASDFRINVLEWMEDFFVVENDTNRDKDDESDVLFHESQIGYIPEGFEKVEEDMSYSIVAYRYQNSVGEYVSVCVYRDKGLSGIDIDKTKQDVNLNAIGMEYGYAYKRNTKEHIITWADESGRFYSLIGTAMKSEIIRVMESIVYQEEKK